MTLPCSRTSQTKVLARGYSEPIAKSESGFAAFSIRTTWRNRSQKPVADATIRMSRSNFSSQPVEVKGISNVNLTLDPLYNDYPNTGIWKSAPLRIPVGHRAV